MANRKKAVAPEGYLTIPQVAKLVGTSRDGVAYRADLKEIKILRLKREGKNTSVRCIHKDDVSKFIEDPSGWTRLGSIIEEFQTTLLTLKRRAKEQNISLRKIGGSFYVPTQYKEALLLSKTNRKEITEGKKIRLFIHIREMKRDEYKAAALKKGISLQKWLHQAAEAYLLVNKGYVPRGNRPKL